MQLGNFAALTFDCYGTLIDWERGILAALRPWAARRGVRADDDMLLAAFGRAESRRESTHPTTSYPDILALVLRDMGDEFGVPVDDGESTAFGRSVSDWPTFADSRAALAYLKQHFRLVIVSNVDRESFRHSGTRLGVEFDAVITADDAGAYKPALNHFHVALERIAAMGIVKGKVLHVAQSLYHDHVPAKRLGLTTVWINRRAGRSGGGATPPAVPVTPDWEFSGLAALVDLHRAESGA